MQTQSSTSYQPYIDGLRAMAVLAVIVFHSFPDAAPGGFVGVDVFFVISGFLITGIIVNGLQSNTFTFSNFYARRIRRIFPALTAVLAVTLLLGYLFLFSEEYRNLGKHTLSGATFAANITLWRDSGYFDSAAEFKPLLHLWSLGVEEQYYAIWPLVLVACHRARWSMLRVATIVCLASFALNLWASHAKPIANFFLLPGRLWELMAGAILALLMQNSSELGRKLRQSGPSTKRELIAISGLALIAGALVLIDSMTIFPGWAALAPVLGTCLLIAAGPSTLINRKLFAHPLAVYIGLLSYPLYLWHWPLLAFGRVTLPEQQTSAIVALLVLGAFALSAATYHWIELPIRFSLRNRPSIIPSLCVAMAAMGATGAAAFGALLPTRLTTPATYAIEGAIGDWDYPIRDSNFKRAGGFQAFSKPANSGSSAMFIGDSHVEQYWVRAQAVVDADGAASRSAVFVTHPGCLPMPDANRTDAGYFCNRFFDFAMDAAMRGDVDTVVFGAAWEAYFISRSTEAMPPNEIYYMKDAARRTVVVPSPSADQLFHEFEQRLASLTQRGKKVVVILSNPAGRAFDPRSMLPDRLKPSGRRNSVHAVSRRELTEAARPVVERLRAVAASAGASIVDPMDYFCTATTCPTATDDGRPIYSDSNHIRPFYVRQKAAFIDEILHR